MPKYTYFCKDCKFSYEVVHRISEIQSVCKSCGSDKGLNKVPTSFNFASPLQKNNKIGTLVNEVIEESKRDIEEAKTELRNREYED